jgi:c-di-GMP-binding flagellar brake protein YcgR
MSGPITRMSRKLARFNLDKRVRVTLTVDGKAVVLHGRSCDLSEGGICAVISGELNIGDNVVFEITGLEEGSLSLTAVVRHSRGFYYGFQFVQLDARQSAAVVKLITRNATPKFRVRS